MSLQEEDFGGCMNQVVRIGDTVHRIVKGGTMVHSYLCFLEKADMTGVPRFLGLDEQGREILTYLPGKTQEHDHLINHPCMRSDDTLIDMARFMRKLHDVSVDFLQEAEAAGWVNPDHPEQKRETICHNDAAGWNFVFVDDRLAGLIDFDSACPGTRLWDLTTSVYSIVPLTPHVYVPEMDACMNYDPSQHAAERKRRVKLFFDAYGMDCPPDYMDMVARRIEEDFCGGLEKGVAAGDAPSIRAVKGGALAYYQKVTAFIKEHGREWI